MVGGPVSATVQNADTSKLHVYGTAADAYRQLLPAEKAALTAIKTNFADPRSAPS